MSFGIDLDRDGDLRIFLLAALGPCNPSHGQQVCLHPAQLQATFYHTIPSLFRRLVPPSRLRTKPTPRSQNDTGLDAYDGSHGLLSSP